MQDVCIIDREQDLKVKGEMDKILETAAFQMDQFLKHPERSCGMKLQLPHESCFMKAIGPPPAPPWLEININGVKEYKDGDAHINIMLIPLLLLFVLGTVVIWYCKFKRHGDCKLFQNSTGGKVPSAVNMWFRRHGLQRMTSIETPLRRSDSTNTRSPDSPDSGEKMFLPARQRLPTNGSYTDSGYCNEGLEMSPPTSPIGEMTFDLPYFCDLHFIDDHDAIDLEESEPLRRDSTQSEV